MPTNYIIVIDAGSSASRVHIFSYAPGPPFTIETPFSPKKSKPGLATYAENPKRLGKSHLKKLIRYAAHSIPKDLHSHTPILLHATAGLRLLSQSQTDALLKTTCSYIRDHSSFFLPNCTSQISLIDGPTEAALAWIGANYAGTLHKAPLLAMGGASAQIAFDPTPFSENPLLSKNDSVYTTKLLLEDNAITTLPLVAKSFLGYGVNEIRKKLFLKLGDSNENPCAPRGVDTLLDDGEVKYETHEKTKTHEKIKTKTHDKIKTRGKSKTHEPILPGSNNYSACYNTVRPFANSLPSYPFLFSQNSSIIPVSKYSDTIQKLLPNSSSISGPLLRNSTELVCNSQNSDPDLCFRAVWTLSSLEALGLPDSPVPIAAPAFHAAWPLGRALLYAAAEQAAAPPDSGITAPVSHTVFGAPSTPRPPLPSSRHAPRVAGVLAFVLILLVAVYLLLGTARRARLWKAVWTNRFAKNGYSRVELGNENDVELGELDLNHENR